MTFSPISRAKLGVAADDPFFNDDAAAKMYHEISKMDKDEATVLLQMAAFHVAARDLTKYGQQIESEYKQEVAKRAERVKSALTRNLISKGKDPAPYIAALDDISKAVDGPIDFEISERVKRQWRDPGGRFRKMTQKIEQSELEKPLRGREAQALGIPLPTKSGGTNQKVKLTETQKKRFQGDYYQVLRNLKAVNSDPIGASGAIITLNYNDGDSSQFLASDGEDKLAEKFAGEKYAKNKRLVSVDTSFLRDENPNIDLMAALGTPGGGMRNRTINYVSNNAEGTDPNIRQYRQEMERYNETDPYNPADRAYRRLGATATLLSNVLPDSAVKTQLALNAARWAGFNATEVERVVGPGARKVAYRYRGIEKAPNPGLQQTVDSYIRGNKDKDKARDALINGVNVDVMTQRGLRQEFKESPIISYLVKDLPKKELVNLQTKSGAMPPSRGYIIDRNGKIITEAVGYGDDHYLPFNLKNISRLKGGEYVRTRTLGGPTTEDIYAGLISGARSVTVVSRSGIYTIEFDEAFRGSRRYNDKAARMVGRYGMILDAVKNGNVTLDTIPPDREQELKEAAGRLYDEGTDGFKKELRRLEAIESANPQMSEERRQGLAREFLTEIASRRDTTYEEMVENQIKRELASANADRQAYYLTDSGDWVDVKGNITAKYGDPESIVTAMGLDDQYNKYFETQMKTYKASQAPLKLDGPGYAFALDAMKEQFPYYIKSVKYRQLNQDASSPRTDVGYVKPKFNRPAEVKAGYYDTTITGAGKISADKMNYQNIGVPRKGRVENQEDGSTYNPGLDDEEVSPMDRNSGYRERKVQEPTMGNTQKDSAIRLRETLQKRTQTDRDFMSPTFNKNIPAGSVLDEGFRKYFPYTFGMTSREFSEAWDDNPTLVENRMEKELRELSEFFIFGNAEESMYRKFKNRGKDPVVKYDRENPPIAEILRGAKVDFDDELYMPGIASSRILAKIESGRDIEKAKSIIAGALESAGVKDARDLVDSPDQVVNSAAKQVLRQQADVVKAVQIDRKNLGNRVYSEGKANEILDAFEEIVKYVQLSDNYVESVQAEIERQREREMIEASANRNNNIIISLDDPKAADAFRDAVGLPKQKIIDEDGNYVNAE